MLPQLHAYDYVNHPFDPVAKALVADALGIFQRATTVATSRADDLRAKLHAHVGPIDVTTEVTIELGPIDESPLGAGRPAIRIPLTWRAVHNSNAFPVMQAELTSYPLTPTETQLELAGTYAPPFGAIGRTIDKAVLHRIAQASVLQFLQEVARYLREDLPK